MQEARALRDAGYHVSVICPKGRGFEKVARPLRGLRSTVTAFGGLRRARLFSGVRLGPHRGVFLALRIYARTRFRVLQACNPPTQFF